ncbi:hypothetical protein CEXT_153541, partial [Caerostris extrusa]
QDADSFKDKIGGFKKSIKKYCRVRVLLECRWGKFSPNNSNVVNEAFKSQGPFDGILGFSQGGALAALICALKRKSRVRA